MPGNKPQTFTFDQSDLSVAVEKLEALSVAGKGWVNITPAEVEAPKRTSIWGRINGRGPEVPRLTWTAPKRKGNKSAPAQLGIEHAAGTKALAQLAAANHPLPPRWQRLQDHPMRGLVLIPNVECDAHETLVWALGAVEILSGFPALGRWRLEVWG